MTEKGSNHQLLKQKNLQLLMKQIYLNSPISRVELAQAVGLTTPAITGLITPLITRGLLQETCAKPEDNKAAGRPRVMLEFAPEVFYCCGVDISPYQINYVITDLRGDVLHKKSTDKKLDVYSVTFAELAREIPLLLREANVAKEKLLGVGICMPGLIDGEADRIYDTFREGWTSHNLSAELGKVLGIRVEVENNVRARAICAHLVDRMVTGDPFAYFYVSYGVACQMIIDDRVLYGQRAAAGEIGHTVVQPGGAVCPSCGNRGCLEAIAGEMAILDQCRELVDRGEGSVLRALCPEPEALTIDHVLQAQEQGDHSVNAIVENALNYLGIALANVINLISPRAILVEGQLFRRQQNQQLFLSSVIRNGFCVHEDDLHIQFKFFDMYRGAKSAAAVVIRDYLNHITL